VKLMRDFGVTAIIGFGDYIKRLAKVAASEGLMPGEDIPIRVISGHLGAETAATMAEAWPGAEVFDWYGVGDTGIIAGEITSGGGMVTWEDAQFLEILDVDTHAPVADGEIGDMVCTCLYKDDVFPIIRFNTHDVSQEVAASNSLDLPFRSIAGFMGRSDNMVKLRGINIYPQGIGTLLAGEYSVATGEFYCEVRRECGREEMIVVVEATDQDEALCGKMEATLRTRLGVAIEVRLVSPGSTAKVTGIETRQKPIRLVSAQ